MTSRTIKVRLNWKLDFDSKEFREVIASNKRLQPQALIIRPKYAEHLEFGTGPAMNSSDGRLESAIKDWVRIKLASELGIDDRNEIDRLTQKVLYSIRKHGLRARPFFRPAFYYMCEHLQEWFDQGFDFDQIIAFMESKVRDLIDFNINAVPPRNMNYTGNLRFSANLYTRPLSPEEASEALNPPIAPRPISDDLWEQRSRMQGRII